MKDQIKKINLVIKGNCCECPYKVYDPDYSISYDSGYDCGHEDGYNVGRIVNDWDVNNSNNKKPKGWPPIPDKCPLKNTTEEEYEKFINEE